MANTIGWGQAAVNNTIDWGKGKTNNAIGWGSIYSSSPSGETDISGTPAGDADANAFIAAAAITKPVEQAAIDKLVVDLKGYGIWTKMKAIYPFIGGTAAQHKFNLRSPIDSDAAFRLVFNGGWVHSSTGAKPNGVNGFANSFFNPSLHNLANSSHLSYYSRTLFTDVNVVSEIGCIGTSGSARNAINASYSGTTYCLPNNNSELSVNFVSNGVGFYVASRTSATAIMGQRNSTQYTGSATTTRLNQVVGIGANSSIDSGTGWAYYSPRESAFASIGDGLSTTEAANYYTAVQAFQTTLGRNV